MASKFLEQTNMEKLFQFTELDATLGGDRIVFSSLSITYNSHNKWRIA